ncbi:MAG: tRNA pseudouridine(38-40) synthase TruA [Gammaproteobacteria bacterium]|nr:tRNA pseudouridine(38-40) synthase TruA [Gammaproteobacteria bacterium]
MIGTDAPGAGQQRRIALGIEYDGTAYHGWQKQPHAPSVQETLSRAVSAVANEQVECIGAGRTDAGVHASGQVAHFDTGAERRRRSWLLGINSRLPPDINVLWVMPVAPEFHARFSARFRAYRYLLLNRPVRSALLRHRAWWVHAPLDAELMHSAAQTLIGTHDFSSFRAAACQAKTPVRTLTDMVVERRGDRIELRCRADAFLHHMVRNVVGSLVRVGLGVESPDWIAAVLEARNRRAAGPTAPAAGLTLTAAEYPAELLDMARVRVQE